MEEKSGDEKLVVEEQKEENEAEASVDLHVNEKGENSDAPEKKLNGASKKKEKEVAKEKVKSSPEREVKKDTEEKEGSAKKKPISSFFGMNFKSLLCHSK